jgi:hypothetical protein
MNTRKFECKNFYKDINWLGYHNTFPKISSISLKKYKPKVYMMQLKMQSRTQGIGGINNDVGHGTKM